MIVIGQYSIAYSSQMAKHNFVTNMKCMHKKEYCKYNIKNAMILSTQL